MSINTRLISDALVSDNEPYKLARIVMNETVYTLDVRMRQLRNTELPWLNIPLTRADVFNIKLRILQILKRKDKNDCTVQKSGRT